MNSMDALPRVVATYVGTVRVELLWYPDGSLEVRRDGLMQGTWGESEMNEGVRAFFAMIGVPDEFVLRLHNRAAPRCDALN